jgi:hypothetical protein
MIARKIRPTVNHIVTTMDRYEEDDSKLLVDANELAGVVKDVQKVVAVGPLVRDIQVGDYVRICPDRYIKVKHTLSEELNDKEMQVSINFPVVDLEDGRYLFLYESDVDYVIEEFAPEKTEKLLYEPPIIIK